MVLKSLSSSFWKISSTVISFVERMYILSVIGKEFVGQIDYLIGFSLIILTVISFGLFNYMTKEIAIDRDGKGPNYVLTQVFMLQIILFLLSSPFLIWGLTFYVGLPPVKSLFVLLVVLSYLFSDNVFFYFTSIKEPTKASFLAFSVYGLRLFACILFFKIFGPCVESYFIAFFISYLVIAFLYLWGKLERCYPDFSILWQAKYFALLSLLQIVYMGLPRIMQKRVSDYVGVAMLTGSMYVLNFINIFSLVFSLSYSPIFAKLAHEGDCEKMQRHFRRGTRIALLFTIPGIIFTLMNAKNIIELVSGSGSKEGVQILSWIMIIAFLSPFNSIGRSMLRMSKKEKYLVLNSSINFVLFISFVYLLGSRYVYGIAMSSFFCEAIYFLILNFELNYLFALSMVDFREISFIILIGIFECLMCHFFFRAAGIWLIPLGLFFLAISSLASLMLSPYYDYAFLMGGEMED